MNKKFITIEAIFSLPINNPEGNSFKEMTHQAIHQMTDSIVGDFSLRPNDFHDYIDFFYTSEINFVQNDNVSWRVDNDGIEQFPSKMKDDVKYKDNNTLWKISTTPLLPLVPQTNIGKLDTTVTYNSTSNKFDIQMSSHGIMYEFTEDYIPYINFYFNVISSIFDTRVQYTITNSSGVAHSVVLDKTASPENIAHRAANLQFFLSNYHQWKTYNRENTDNAINWQTWITERYSNSQCQQNNINKKRPITQLRVGDTVVSVQENVKKMYYDVINISPVDMNDIPVYSVGLLYREGDEKEIIWLVLEETYKFTVVKESPLPKYDISWEIQKPVNEIVTPQHLQKPSPIQMIITRIDPQSRKSTVMSCINVTGFSNCDIEGDKLKSVEIGENLVSIYTKLDKQSWLESINITPEELKKLEENS